MGRTVCVGCVGVILSILGSVNVLLPLLTLCTTGFISYQCKTRTLLKISPFLVIKLCNKNQKDEVMLFLPFGRLILATN